MIKNPLSSTSFDDLELPLISRSHGAVSNCCREQPQMYHVCRPRLTPKRVVRVCQRVRSTVNIDDEEEEEIYCA